MFYSTYCIPAAADALIQCITVVIPSLFPFLVLTEILNNSALLSYIGNKSEKVANFLFKVSGNAFSIIIISYLCGFPAAAKITSDFYKNGKISYSDAIRLSCFTNNPGPLFLIGTVGVGFLDSAFCGVKLYLVQISASLLCGVILNNFLFRNTNSHIKNSYKNTSIVFNEKKTLDIIVNAINNSFNAMLPITGTIVFFTFLSEAIIGSGMPVVISGLFSPDLSREYTDAYIRCLFELTGGLSAIIPLYIKSAFLIPIISFICGWSGMAIHMQVTNFYIKEKIPVKYYFAGKMITTVISGILSLLFFV